MNFAFVYIYHNIYRKWVSLVDSKCRNTVILTGLTYTSSWKVFRDGCAKRGIFSQQILNKNSLSLAHCALNRSFTVLYLFCIVFIHNSAISPCTTELKSATCTSTVQLTSN